LAELPRYGPRRYAIHLGGEVLDERALFIALANSRQYGNGAQIAPQAKLDDGRLDLVVVRAQSLARVVGQIPAFFRGTLRSGPGLLMRPAERLEIEGDGPIRFHVDGEPRTGPRRLRVRIWSGHLCVAVNC
jgi:diacylglycerol kinase family enzyme